MVKCLFLFFKFFFSVFFLRLACFLVVAVKCGKLMFNWTNQVLFLLFVFTAMHQPAWSRLKLLEAPSSPPLLLPAACSVCVCENETRRDETSGASKSGNRTRINERNQVWSDNANRRRPHRQRQQRVNSGTQQQHSNMDWAEGDLVWFDPGVGHPIPGEIQEVHRAAQVIVVQAMIKGKVSVSSSCCPSIVGSQCTRRWCGWRQISLCFVWHFLWMLFTVFTCRRTRICFVLSLFLALGSWQLEFMARHLSPAKQPIIPCSCHASQVEKCWSILVESWGRQGNC